MTADARPAAQVGTTVADSVEAWPDDAVRTTPRPNVVVIVLDDAGFGHLGCYGSDIATPHIDALAEEGLRYTSFHTTSLCSPTRASLLTGRNHHTVGMGSLVERGTGYPGYHARIPSSSAFLSEILRERGYATYAVGKWHLTPWEEASAAGPYDRWPLGKGFERYYGFLSGEINQWSPRLTYDNHRVKLPDRDDYHLTADITDHAAEFVRDLRNVSTEKPFFLYYCPGAVHAPHHVPPEYADRYAGVFDDGWDAARTRVLERQKSLGLMPEHVALPPRNPGVAPWAELSADEQRVHARMQEVFAGFLTHTDEQIGRLVAVLGELGELDNTMILLLSDNGASAEGGEHGTANELRYFNQLADSFEDVLAAERDLGGPATYNHFSTGWTMVGNTPFRLFKRWVFEGGVADPLIIRWPERVRDPGGVRTQYHHVVDLVPTVLELLDIDVPGEVGGVAQTPFPGVSMAYTLDSKEAATAKRVQYYEMYGNRGLWCDGWKVVSDHRPGAETGVFDGDRWALFHTDEDPNELHDLSQTYPERTRELVEQWWTEASRYGVLPLDDRQLSRISTAPRYADGRTLFTYYPGGSDIPQYAAADVRNRSHRLTATVSYESGDGGVLYAQGGAFGGFVLFVQDGRLVYAHNMLGAAEYVVVADHGIPEADNVALSAEFRRTGEHRGEVTLAVGADVVGVGEIPRTVPVRYDNDGAVDIGLDRSLGVSRRYRPPYPYSGGLRHVVVELRERPVVDEDADFTSALRQQ
ncbi:MAG: arylsulfatase [Nocardioidaceae bacterium]